MHAILGWDVDPSHANESVFEYCSYQNHSCVVLTAS